jgi:hypothetical protein
MLIHKVNMYMYIHVCVLGYGYTNGCETSIMDAYFGVDAQVLSPPPALHLLESWPGRMWGWMRPVLVTTDAELLATAGLDALMLDR